MKLHCLETPEITPAVRYALEHILHQIGFFFDWTTRLTESDLLVCYGSEKKLVPAEGSVIYLPAYCDLARLGRQQPEWRVVDFAGLSLPVLGAVSFADETVFPFDITANVFYHLTRLEESQFRTPEQADASFPQSVLHTTFRHQIPVVDHLIRYFERFVMEFARKRGLSLVKKTVFPKGETFGLALTHDVDLVRAYHPLKKAALKIAYYLRLTQKPTPQEMEQADRAYWIFDRLLNDYTAGDWKATFFFIARYTEQTHFRYRVNSARFRALFRLLKSAGQEIALHPSRFAFDHPKRYRKEKTRLEKFAGTKVTGMRHHYLRCLFPQIWTIAEQIGLEYEASMIYNHQGGFRAGTAHLFSTFDALNHRPLHTVAVPTAFFEKSLPDNGQDEEKNKNYVLQLLENIQRVNGVLTALWHTNNIYRDETAPGFWPWFLNEMKAKHAFNATLAGHTRWYLQRKGITLSFFEQTGKQAVLQLALPEELDGFGLVLPENRWRLVQTAPSCTLRQSGDTILLSGSLGIRTLELIFDSV